MELGLSLNRCEINLFNSSFLFLPQFTQKGMVFKVNPFHSYLTTLSEPTIQTEALGWVNVYDELEGRKRSKGILPSVDWYFVTDVSGQHIGPICKVHAVQ
jgi:hypothetical protein